MLALPDALPDAQQLATINQHFSMLMGALHLRPCVPGAASWKESRRRGSYTGLRGAHTRGFRGMSANLRCHQRFPDLGAYGSSLGQAFCAPALTRPRQTNFGSSRAHQIV